MNDEVFHTKTDAEADLEPVDSFDPSPRNASSEPNTMVDFRQLMESQNEEAARKNAEQRQERREKRAKEKDTKAKSKSNDAFHRWRQSDQEDGRSSINGNSNDEQRQYESHRHYSPHQKRTLKEMLTADSVYEFYVYELFPALAASIPILCHRFIADASVWFHKFLDFISPTSSTGGGPSPAQLAQQLWEQATTKASNLHSNSTAAVEVLIRHLNISNTGDPTASFAPLNVTEFLTRILQQAQTASAPPSLWAWFSREWPLMDWKIGLFLWRTFGGLLFFIAILSIVPGRLHAVSGKLLRWPVLGVTYFLILVELMVYIVIRLAIRLVESLVASPKHRGLRNKMAKATSYETWYQYAAALDLSQGRTQWQRQNEKDDKNSHRYNWALIRQLLKDLKAARAKNDSLLALAVLQQCTRKNVGGIMSEDLFSFTNTGETKDVVKEFIEAVTETLKWITDEALLTSSEPEADEGEEPSEAQKFESETRKGIAAAVLSPKTRNSESSHDSASKRSYQKELNEKIMLEKDKVWKSVVRQAVTSGAFSTDSSPTRLQKSKSFGHGDKERASSRDKPNGKKRSENDDDDDLATFRPVSIFHREHILQFLKRARASYGRTALCLSGGGMMGLYHFGHLKALMETGCLPKIISGTSAGSVVGSIFCTRTEEELKRDLKPEILGTKIKCFSRPWPDRIRSVWENGNLFDFNEWMDMIKWFTCGDLTFEEAYKKTGRIFCITLSSPTKKAPPVLLNYISAPTVTIASAVIASAAVPGFIPPVQLQYKNSDGVVYTKGTGRNETYFDGSIRQDIPTNGLAEMLNCQFFIAAQCNPHIAPFFAYNQGGVGKPNRWSSGGRQEESWRGGFLLSALEMYLKNDMKAKFVFLNNIEAAVGFTSTLMTQKFVGSTTIVPHMRFTDFFKIFSDPDPTDLENYFQGGSVATYQHVAMIRLHYSVADALEECIEKLENPGKSSSSAQRRSAYRPKQSSDLMSELDKQPHLRRRASAIPKLSPFDLNDEHLSSDTASLSDRSM